MAFLTTWADMALVPNLCHHNDWEYHVDRVGRRGQIFVDATYYICVISWDCPFFIGPIFPSKNHLSPFAPCW
jgi:hypothetical protein